MDGPSADWDGPIDEIAAQMEAVLSQGNAVCFQKFTCAGCGARLGMDVPDVLFESGLCDCGATTDLRARGCGFAAIIGNPAEILATLSWVSAPEGQPGAPAPDEAA